MAGESAQEGTQESETSPGTTPSSVSASAVSETFPDSQAPSIQRPPTSPAFGRDTWLLGLTLLVVLVSLVFPIARAGIWDPFELEVAELARRVGIHVLGAGQLALVGSDNSPVTQGVLGRGELPFTSIALGFACFGLREWAGRLILALWGLLGVGATFGLLARLSDRRTAAFGAAILATLPLYFCHARTLLGDGVTFATVAWSCACLGVALFDERRPSVRAGALLLAVLGLGASFLARGILVGCAVPLVGVGLAWGVQRGGGAARPWRLTDSLGLGMLTAGLGATVLGLLQLKASLANPDHYNWLLGFSIQRAAVLPTFDLELGRLGHALFPFSALIPWALGRMLGSPPGLSGEERERDTGLRLVLLCSGAVSYAAHILLAPVAQGLSFTAVFAVAGIIALALRDHERGASSSTVGAMGVAAVAVLLFLDFRNAPGTIMEVFGPENTSLPESFVMRSTRTLGLVAGAFVGLSFFPMADRSGPDAPRFCWAEYRAWPDRVVGFWNGNLLFLLVVSEALLVGISAVALGATWFPPLRSYSLPPGPLVDLGWLAPVAVLVTVPLVTLARDAFRWVHAGLGASRGLGLLAISVGSGLILSLAYFPALASQLSPKHVFEAYQSLAQAGEPLGLLDVSHGTASYYTGGDLPSFDGVPGGFSWLTEGSSRRWLVARHKDLAFLNSLYRGQGAPSKSRNLPVLDATSSEILLVSNQLSPGEQNYNPLTRWILDRRPTPAHPLSVDLGGQLDVLGWEVRQPGGAAVDEVVPGKRYEFCIYFEVKNSLGGSWQTFIHIDGFHRRYNGDHDPLKGEYPLYLWRVGDFLADVHEFTLEPNFSPGGYDVYFGLFLGDRRLEVKRGAHDENRVIAGKLRVR